MKIDSKKKEVPFILTSLLEELVMKRHSKHLLAVRPWPKKPHGSREICGCVVFSGPPKWSVSSWFPLETSPKLKGVRFEKDIQKPMCALGSVDFD